MPRLRYRRSSFRFHIRRKGHGRRFRRADNCNRYIVRSPPLQTQFNQPFSTARAVLEKELPGFGEAMRMEGFKHTPRAMGSRAIAGIYKQTLIINLPGSPKGVAENLAVVLPVIPHTIGLIKGKVSDCAKDREKHA